MSLIGKSVGNYRITAQLGEGGMGAVYLGEHPLIGKRVAVKVLLPELASNADIVQRFFNEAKAVNDIGHQNIVDVVDFGKMRTDEGMDVVYFVMEYLDGESLGGRLKKSGMTADETVHVMSQCCSALAASHARGIVHRDLKPDNIYLCPRGRDRNFVKLLDFGIAKLTGDGNGGHNKTRTGMVMGTPAYMSPEQCEGKGLIDHRSDVYSLGVVMYQLLTGRVPFVGEGFGEILVAHLTKTPTPPSQLNPDVPPALEAVVMRAIDKDRERRFQTMDEFERALHDPNSSTATMVGEAPRGPLSEPSRRITTLSGASGQVGGEARSGARNLLVAAAGLALAGAVGAGWFALSGHSEPGGAPNVAAKVAPVTPAAAAQPTVEWITVNVASEPSGARVLRDGRELGTTPFDLKVQQGDPSFDIEIAADHYASQKRHITTARSKELVVQLVRAPEPAAAPTTTAAHHSGHAKGHPTRHADNGNVGDGLLDPGLK